MYKTDINKRTFDLVLDINLLRWVLLPRYAKDEIDIYSIYFLCFRLWWYIKPQWMKDAEKKNYLEKIMKK